MYGKIFKQMYEGTLAGHWQAIVTMQQLVVLATKDGIVDMTPESIARTTSIPLNIITAGLEHLSKADPYSRTPGEDGRRIVLLDDHRPWGWKLVNHAKYRALRNQEEKREADRKRIAEKRKKNSDVATPSRSVANVAHTDADAKAGKSSAAIAAEGRGGAATLPDCPHEKLISLYHEVLPTCTRVVEWNGERQALMRARWREQSVSNGKRPGYATEAAGLAFWRRFFTYVEGSVFLTGRAEATQGRTPFVATLEWLIRPKNFAKVVEGTYHRQAQAA